MTGFQHLEKIAVGLLRILLSWVNALVPLAIPHETWF